MFRGTSASTGYKITAGSGRRSDLPDAAKIDHQPSYPFDKSRLLSMLWRALAVAILAQSAIFAGLPTIPRAHASNWAVDFNEQYSYWGGWGGSTTAPPAKVAIVGSGVNKSALPSGLVVSSALDASRDLQDPLVDGGKRDHRPLLGAVYPASNEAMT